MGAVTTRPISASATSRRSCQAAGEFCGTLTRRRTSSGEASRRRSFRCRPRVGARWSSSRRPAGEDRGVDPSAALQASDKLTTTRSAPESRIIAGMSSTAPTTRPRTVRPIPPTSASAKPTISTPSSCRRSFSSQASATAARFVPTIRPLARRDARRQPGGVKRHDGANQMTGVPAASSTPGPNLERGNQNTEG